MKILISIEYIVNLGLLIYFHMYMFQLNSYSTLLHTKWMKVNYKKIGIQIILITVAFLFTLIQNTFAEFISIIILGISIITNIIKNKKKIPFAITNRVKRMLATEIAILLLIIVTGGINNLILLKLMIINILSIFIGIVANYINIPIEKHIQNRYIKQAKDILKRMPGLIVIGITGSYGKTSVKNFLEKILSTKYEVLATPKNYNTPMGVVKTIRENLKSTHQIFICEMGARKPGHIKEICDIVNPSIGIITAIGPQHLETFKDINGIIKTKFELVEHIKKNNGTMFLNFDNEYLRKEKTSDIKIKTYGIDNSNLDYKGYNIYSSDRGLEFKIFDRLNQEVTLKTKLIGKHNIINIMGAISIADYLGVEIKKIISAVRELKNVEHRLEVKKHGNMTIIDDSYNSNPISSKSALETLASFEGIKIVVTPGLIELGDDEEKYNYELGKNLSKVCDYIYLVGEQHSRPIKNGILENNFKQENIFIVNTPNEAVANIRMMNLKDKVNILLENDLPDNYNL